MALYLAGVGFCSLTALTFGAYKIIRRRFPSAVSCWFCGEKCEIPCDQINAWDCPHCDQYNGFSEDGGYNKTIPAQFYEELNIQPTLKSKPDSVSDSVSDSVAANGDVRQTANLLCVNCTQNQCLKLKQLANFVPSTEESFSVEVDAYQLHLEQVYRLCRVCEVSVRKELTRQDAIIQAAVAESGACAAWNQAKDNSDLSAFCQNDLQLGLRRPIAYIFHSLSAVCASALIATGLYVASSSFNLRLPMPLSVTLSLEFLSDRAVPLLIVGTFAKIAAVFISGLIRLLALDACSCFCWLMMMMLFFLLEDSHVYSRILISTRLGLSILNLILTVMSGLKLTGSATKRLGQLSKTSPNIQWMRNDLNGFSKPENADFSDEDSSYRENRKEFVDVPCVKLRRLRLGTPVPKEKHKDPFKVFGNSALFDGAENTPAFDHHKHGVSRRYPLLSPPKFCPSGGSQLQKTLLSNGLWSGNGTRQHTNANIIRSASDVRFNGGALVDERRHPTAGSVAGSDDSSSAGTSLQPSSVRTSFFLKLVLTVSLVVNIIAILFVFLKFRTNVSVDAVKAYIQNLFLS